MIAAVDHAVATLLAAPPGSGEALLLSVGIATFMGTVLALSYRVAWGKGYNRDIAASQVMLAALMAMVMLAVGDSLGRAFGSVGILGVMRFRIKLRSTGDALALLSAIVTGMSAGVGLYRLAFAGGAVLAVLTIVLAGFFSIYDKPEPAGSE